MDLFNLWPMMGGDATAEEARQRRAQRWDEPAPLPAQILAGMAQPFTTFNEPGRDPVQMGADLGMLGISPFMGRIATAKPAMTAQEQLWKRAQEGDIHAKGQLTGEMWQRDLAELQGPPAPEPVFPGDLPPARGLSEPPSLRLEDLANEPIPEASPPLGFDPTEMWKKWDWNGEKWIKKQSEPPMDFSPMPPAGPEGYVGPSENLPWEGHIPQPMDEFGQIPLHPDDPASGILRNSLSYDEWQQLLSQLQARPLPPQINPFAAQRWKEDY